jgi:6-phosphogluconolactonase (cycloisomerase 2 family)
VQVLSSLPPDFTGESTGAEIAVSANARFVYCSNRGHDSIAAYSVDLRTGLLTSAGWTPSQGQTPRYIGVDPTGRFLYAANETGDSVVGFVLNPTTGKLTPAGQSVSILSPVTIAFRTAKS